MAEGKSLKTLRTGQYSSAQPPGASPARDLLLLSLHSVTSLFTFSHKPKHTVIVRTCRFKSQLIVHQPNISNQSLSLMKDRGWRTHTACALVSNVNNIVIKCSKCLIQCLKPQQCQCWMENYIPPRSYLLLWWSISTDSVVGCQNFAQRSSWTTVSNSTPTEWPEWEAYLINW